MALLPYMWVLPLVPLAVFAFSLAAGRRVPKQLVSGLGIGAMALVFTASAIALRAVIAGGRFEGSVRWMSIGSLVVDVGVRVDALSALMLVVVSFVSLVVQVYSIGYMHGDDRYRWYFAAISFFTAAMLGVVLADNWLQMYACWELMGLASYLLIGFWFAEPAATKAAMKAFLVTRFGDVGFGLALVTMWWGAHSFGFEAVFRAVETHAWVGPAVTAAALLLFLGAMGKSAQFPLHVWLPDAMAGPTPGSALIHAATMVAAGVYLVARSYPLFEAAPVTLAVVGTIGTITAVMAALIAVAMHDIKKVLAYSTISQLGYMMLALGTGNWIAAIFHLMTHAFFKALLFLGAGSVIHATGTQDLHKMGGLWRKMPWTTATWVLGALSLAGIPPLAGFWSKDEILLSALNSGRTGFLVAGLVTACLTAFYMGRATILAFFVQPGPESGSEHAHESPWVMTVPLVILATLAVIGGLVGSPAGGNAFARFFGEVPTGGMNLLLAAVAVGVALGGIGLAWSMYLKRYLRPDVHLENRFVNAVLSRKFWIDEVYETVILTPLMAIARFSHRIDAAVVDGAVRGVGVLGDLSSRSLARFDTTAVDRAFNEFGDSVEGLGRRTRKMQTGSVQDYLLYFMVVVVLIVLVFAR